MLQNVELKMFEQHLQVVQLQTLALTRRLEKGIATDLENAQKTLAALRTMKGGIRKDFAAWKEQNLLFDPQEAKGDDDSSDPPTLPLVRMPRLLREDAPEVVDESESGEELRVDPVTL